MCGVMVIVPAVVVCIKVPLLTVERSTVAGDEFGPAGRAAQIDVLPVANLTVELGSPPEGKFALETLELNVRVKTAAKLPEAVGFELETVSVG